MNVVKTGVFATDDEIAECRQRAKEVRECPVIFIAGKWLPDSMREDFSTYIDTLAVAHGLPEPGLVDGETNHWGMSNNGEFVRLATGDDTKTPEAIEEMSGDQTGVRR